VKFVSKSTVFSELNSWGMNVTSTVINDEKIQYFFENEIPSNISSISVLISFNSGFSFHEIGTNIAVKGKNSKNKSIEIPILDSIENVDSKLKQDASAFTFRKTLLKLSGRNFPSSNIQIKIQNEKFSTIFKNGIKFISSNVIEFESPLLEQYNFSSSFRFPIFFSLGISFNDGNEYTQKDFVFLDKYANLFLYQVTPTIFPKRNVVFNIQGVGFEYAKQCVFKMNSTIIYESNTTLVSSSTIQCQLNINSLLKGSLIVYIVNQFNDTSNAFHLNIYGKRSILIVETPSIYHLSKTEEYSIGGFILGVYGSNFSEFDIYCKFGNILCPSYCKRINDSYLECPVDSYPNGEVDFSISYNSIDWIMSPQKFTFLPCDAGKTAVDFKSNCTLCPPGTFKPTKGIYVW
jgi:hypothetical protein